MSPTAPAASPRLAGHVLVEALIAQGVDTVFGVPGESYLAVLDGFYEHRDRIRFIACRHEGGAAFMAEAQGKLTGRPGVLLRDPRPRRDQRHHRRAHCVPGLHAADPASSARWPPTSATARRSRRSTTARCSARAPSAWPSGSARSTTPARLPEYVARAFHTAMQGRPGPGGAGAAGGHADFTHRRSVAGRASSRRTRLAGARRIAQLRAPVDRGASARS